MCFYVIWLRHSPARFQGFAPVLSSTTTTTTALGPLDWSLNSVVFSILSSFLLCLFLFRSLVHVPSLNSAKISISFEKWNFCIAFVSCFIAINCAREEKAINVDHHKADPHYSIHQKYLSGSSINDANDESLGSSHKKPPIKSWDREKEREWVSESDGSDNEAVLLLLLLPFAHKWGSVSTV